MIDDTDILKAVRAQLKAAWPDVDVNLDDVQRSFRLPCFFLRFFELDSPQMVYSRSLKRSCTLHIDYFTQKNRNSAIELYKVRKRLPGALHIRSPGWRQGLQLRWDFD